MGAVLRSLAAALLVAASSGAAQADVPPEPPSACTVAKKCSARGVQCDSADRACQEGAIGSELEIVCERRESDGLVFVYCPAGAAPRDSPVVWLLLAVAIGIAALGGAVAWRVLGKRS